jgi:predicted component of viral defense system (DUF524 family)
MPDGNYADAQKEYDEIKGAYMQLRSLYRKHFPKVDPRLLQEIITHTSNSSENKDRMYSIQVIAKKGTDPEKARSYFLSKTEKVPATYEGGTHYVINVFPTLNMIKDIQSYSEVEEITGDYTFGSSSVQSTHTHRGIDEQERIVKE